MTPAEKIKLEALLDAFEKVKEVGRHEEITLILPDGSVVIIPSNDPRGNVKPSPEKP